MYQLTHENGVRRISDDAFIPADPDNRDFAEYRAWLDAGNTPQPVPEPAAAIPVEVTMRQARLALLSAGLYEAVEAAINSLPDPPRTAARIEWDYSNTIQRHNAFVAQLTPMLGLTEEQVDALFTAAAAIPAS